MVLPAGDGGAGGTTGTYAILGQEPTIMVQGANRAVDAVTVTAQDGVYGVVFQFTKSRLEWEGQIVTVAAADRASWIQVMAQHQHVIGMAYAQDVNSAGLLRDVMVMTVGTPDGAQAVDVSWPLDALNTPGAFQAVDDAFARLMAVAASTG